ncbi:uncharacterized protein [Rutidosis leptorrhynchoides]|uniref:uncharacterized protein isoform X2 n=1 Tax=Rutidosis leptorrhynchoides TaxID=125765 RepID=UPI003A995775
MSHSIAKETKQTAYEDENCCTNANNEDVNLHKPYKILPGDQAGSAYVKLAECHLKVGQKIRSVIVYMEEMITKCWQWRDGWVIGTNQDIKSGSIPFLVFFFLYFKFGAKNPFSQLVL